MKFIGISPEFIKVLASGNLKPQRRYAQVLDYVQYHNPPYMQATMEKELGVPQPSISRLFSLLSEEASIRTRLDFIHKMIGLIGVVAIYEGKWINTAPAIDWISSINHTHRGTIIIYRIPPDNLKELKLLLKYKLGKPTELLIFEDFVLAKPSIEHYFVDNNELDPITALKLNEYHPVIPDRYISLYQGEVRNVIQDVIDLNILLYGEINSLYMHIRTWGILSSESIGRSRKKAVLHMSHVDPAMRGSRIMFLSKSEDNILAYIRVKASRECSMNILNILSTYPYATNLLLLEDGSALIMLVMPSNYLTRIIPEIRNMCQVDSIDVYTQTLSGTVLRQYLPFRNYNHVKRRWDFWNASILTIMKIRTQKPRYRAENDPFVMEWDEKKYIEELRNSMGEEYVRKILREYEEFSYIEKITNDKKKINLRDIIQSGSKSGGPLGPSA
ncbi:MAG: hypothetical protein QXJ33_05325 [Acidilobaceae archaeon]